MFERSSLLQMLLNAEAMTPTRIDFLYGETYALVPSMLLPRFIWPDKPTSQSAMTMLNLRYGLLELNKTGQVTTSIGWGLIAEGYVNFGFLGVAGIGLLTGLFSGGMERWSAGRPLFSLPTLLAIISMVTLITLENDLSYLITVLWQSFIALAIVFYVLARRRRRSAFTGPLMPHASKAEVRRYPP